MDRGRVGVLVALVLFGLGSTWWISTERGGPERPVVESTAGQPLGDGLVVAAGTHLIGSVLPELGQDGPAPAFGSGWFALLGVETDAATAMQRYATQASANGFGSPGTEGPNGAGCRRAGKGDVACRLDYQTAERRLDVRIRVCSSCSTPIAVALLRSTYAPPPEPRDRYPSTAPPLIPPRGPTERLAGGDPKPATARAQTGKQIFPIAGSFRYSPSIHVAADSVGVGTMYMASVCERDFVALIRVTGDPERALERYVRQVFDDETPATRTVQLDGRDLTEVSNDAWKVTLVEQRAEAPVIKLDWCA